MAEPRAKLSSGARHELPDSAFAYIEPGHDTEKVNGRTPDKYRHFPVHDAPHVRNALARAGQGARFAKEAMPKIKAAAKRHGVSADGSDTGRALETLFPEMRFIADRPELRIADGSEKRHITGYAAVFNKTSRRLGGFQEQVMPTAFARALEAVGKGDVNIVCRHNHKDDMVLGTTLAGTHQLAVDTRGLQYDVIPPDHRADVMELVDRGDVRYSSFAFRIAQPGVGDEWGEGEHGLLMRRLHEVELVDTATVLDPAYFDTTAMSRNITGAVESLAQCVDADPAEVRSMLEAGQAARFFRRTDRRLPVIPKPERTEPDYGDTHVLDDPAIALRRWTYADEALPEGDTMIAEEDRELRSEEEIRAAVKPRTTADLCMRYHHGEPCVRPIGHPADGPDAEEGGHAGLCWGRRDGLPCNQHMGHDGDHTPVTVASRSDEGEAPEQRSEPTPATLTGPEAMARMFARKKTLTQLPAN